MDVHSGDLELRVLTMKVEQAEANLKAESDSVRRHALRKEVARLRAAVIREKRRLEQKAADRATAVEHKDSEEKSEEGGEAWILPPPPPVRVKPAPSSSHGNAKGHTGGDPAWVLVEGLDEHCRGQLRLPASLRSRLDKRRASRTPKGCTWAGGDEAANSLRAQDQRRRFLAARVRRARALGDKMRACDTTARAAKAKKAHLEAKLARAQSRRLSFLRRKTLGGATTSARIAAIRAERARQALRLLEAAARLESKQQAAEALRAEAVAQRQKKAGSTRARVRGRDAARKQELAQALTKLTELLAKKQKAADASRARAVEQRRHSPRLLAGKRRFRQQEVRSQKQAAKTAALAQRLDRKMAAASDRRGHELRRRQERARALR